MTYRLTLDNALVARSAAWLALTEHACGGKLDELWAPILFQAGREQLAATLWTGVVKTNQTNMTVQQAGWNLWLRKPTSSQVFSFAAENGNLPMAMPMLAYDTWVNQSQPLLDDLVTDLAGGEKHLPALHNYAPLFAHRGTIGGGHLMNGAWAVVSRHAWLELLSAYQIEATDYREFTGTVRPALEAVQSLKADALRGELDSSLAGFKACVPLLRLGQKEGVGPLAPTAAITARDLLNYGWEMSGLQLGSRYNFVQRRWGVPRQAAPIYRTVTTEVEGLVPFFMSLQYARIHNYVPCLKRLQCVEGFFPRVGFSPHPFSQMPNTPLENARLFVKRLWLRPWEFEWQARVLWDAEGVAEIGPLMSALHDQGGSTATSQVLTYLTALDQAALEKVPGGTELKPALAKNLPQPSDMYYLAIAGHELAKLEPFSRAQAVERLYWRAPDSRLESRVFWQYLYAGAYKSARRFYTQVRKNLTDPVAFSNRMGRTAWLLGYLLDDPELRKMAIQDSASGSSADMMIQIWDAAARNNTKELQARVQDYAGRYDSDRAGDTLGKRLFEFLPLLPALRDSAHEKREQALTHFGKTEMAAIIRWIWIKEFKLPKADAIKFLGGRDTGLFPHVLVQYLEQDEKQTAEALRSIEASGNWRDENLLLGRHLWYQLQRQTEPADIDLKPAQVSYVREAVAAKLNSTPGTREGK